MGVSSVSKKLIVQAQGLEFESENPCEKDGCGGYMLMVLMLRRMAPRKGHHPRSPSGPDIHKHTQALAHTHTHAPAHVCTCIHMNTNVCNP